MATLREERFADLLRLFQIAGAPDPELWALSEVDEDIPQLARFLFLRQAWTRVISDDDDAWIDNTIEDSRRRPNLPGAGVGPALERLLASGADRKDMIEVVRFMQFEMLHSLCYMLEDPGIDEPELAGVSWRLFEIDAGGTPLRKIHGLHESVLETDPTGREMGPRAVVQQSDGANR